MALLAAGTPAPTFKGMNLTGPEINLENYKGKKAVVLIFAPDRVDPTQTNVVKALANKVKDKVELITASRKVPSVSMAKQFLQALGVKFPTLYDPGMAVYKMYGVENPVAIFIIDVNGNIVYSAQADPAKVDIKALEEAIAANVK
jgi:peroxiredoxin